MKTAEEWLAHLKGRTDKISDTTLWGIAQYVADGFTPGGFLTCVLANDLRGAVARADVNNRQHLPELVRLLENEISNDIWGSYGDVWGHIDAKRKELWKEAANG